METSIQLTAFRKCLILLSVLLCSLTTASAAIDKPIKFCGDGGGWPPYTYKKSGKVVGYDVDVLDAVLKPNNIEYTIAMPIWKRCVEGTKVGLYDVAVSATYSEERNRDFILTDEYYSLTPVYVYSKEQFPNGLKVNNAKELEKYNICGVYGFNYDGVGVDSNVVDRSAKSFNQLVMKTVAGRCKLFITHYEIMIGFKIEHGVDYLSQGVLVTKTIPDAPHNKNYMLISKQYPQAQELKQILDSGFAELRKNGQLKQFLKGYE